MYLVDVGEPLRELDRAGGLPRNQVGEAVEGVEEEVGIDLALQGQQLGHGPRLLEVCHRHEVALSLLDEVDGLVDVHDEERHDHDHQACDSDGVPVDRDARRDVPGPEHAHAKGRDVEQVDARDEQDLAPGVVEPVVAAPVEEHREAIALPDQARDEDEPEIARPMHPRAPSHGTEEAGEMGYDDAQEGNAHEPDPRVVDEDRRRRPPRARGLGGQRPGGGATREGGVDHGHELGPSRSRMPQARPHGVRKKARSSR